MGCLVVATRVAGCKRLLPASQAGYSSAMTKRIGIAAVFLVGCAVGGGASHLVVPRASAQQAATLTKWEYKCVSAAGEDAVQEIAAQLGPQAWELAAAAAKTSNQPVWCFKRPKM